MVHSKEAGVEESKLFIQSLDLRYEGEGEVGTNP